MRVQVVVVGPVEREMFVRLADDLLPEGIKRAEQLAWRVVGCGVEVSERLSRLGLSTAIVTGIGKNHEDKEVISALRKRGIQLRGPRSDARAAPVTVRVRTPRHELKMVTSALDSMPSSRAVVRALPGSRHFHVCGSSLTGRQSLDTATNGLARATSVGVTTSLDASHLPAHSAPRDALLELLRHVDILFANSETLRRLTERSRIGEAANSVLELGVMALTVRLGAGGWRVYTRDAANRVPSLGDEVESGPSAFASGYLLGWLLGADAHVSGVLGAAAARTSPNSRLPDRRELTTRLAHTRNNPLFRKLIPALSEAQQLLEKSRRLPRRNVSR